MIKLSTIKNTKKWEDSIFLIVATIFSAMLLYVMFKSENSNMSKIISSSVLLIGLTLLYLGKFSKKTQRFIETKTMTKFSPILTTILSVIIAISSISLMKNYIETKEITVLIFSVLFIFVAITVMYNSLPKLIKNLTST